MPGPVQRGAQQVIHGRIHHAELLAAVVLEVFHLGQQYAGVAHQRTAQFHYPPYRHALQSLIQRPGVVGGAGRGFVVVANTHTAAQIQMLEGNPMGRQFVI